jgi:integrase
MALSDAKVRNAKPKTKPYKIADGEGMFLLITPSGSKYWRLKYHFVGKEKLLALGVYPDVTLSEARDRRAEARKVLKAGMDPGEAKKVSKRLAMLKSDNVFETVAREWHEKQKHGWVPSYSKKMLARLERHAFPKLGHRPISDIKAPEILAMLRVIENRGTLETARIVKQMCGQVFMYAIATGRAERNPVPDLRGALKSPVKKHHAYLKASELPDYLELLNAYPSTSLIKLGLKFLLLTFVRTIELRTACWSNIDFEKAEWRIPAERMKMRDLHIVPLSTQAIAVLRELQKHSGHWQYVFPSLHKPINFMNENALINALHRMGYKSKATCHGFRATASTILNENGFPPDVIERQLAHSESNKVRAAYNHAQYLPERRKMMQWWADHLDELAKKDTAQV